MNNLHEAIDHDCKESCALADKLSTKQGIQELLESSFSANTRHLSPFSTWTLEAINELAFESELEIVWDYIESRAYMGELAF